MNDHKPGSDRPGSNNSTSLIWTSIGGVALVLLIVLIISLGNKLKTIEDELSHCAPETTFGIDISESQIVYVPIYTHIETSADEAQLLDSILGIRNSDTDHAITITSARFYDGRGNLVKEYFDTGPVELAPLEARTLQIKKSDFGDIGAAANFIVAWKSDVPVYEPIIDAIMYGFINGKSITFKSVGRPLAQRIDQAGMIDK